MSKKQTEQNPSSGVFRTTIANATGAFSSLAVAIYLAKLFGPTTIGIYFFYLVVGNTITRLHAGVGASLRKSVRSTELDTSEYYGAGLFISIILLFLIISSSMIVFYELPNDLELGFQLSKPMLFGVLSVIGGQGTFYLVHGPYTANNDSSWVKTIRHITTGITQLIALALGLGIPSLLGIYGAVSLLCSILILISKPIFAVPSGHVIIKSLVQSTITTPMTIVSNFHHKLDVLVLGFIVGFASIGRYELSLKLVIPVMLAATTASGLMATRLRSENSEYKAIELVKNSTASSTILAFPVLAIMSALSVDTIRYIYGEQFIEITWLVLIILSITQLFVALRTPLNLALRSLNKNKTVLTVQTIALITNLPLSIHLAKNHGILGVIGATLIVEILTVLAYMIFIKSELTAAFPTIELFKQTMSAMLAFIVAFSAFYLGIISNYFVYTSIVLLGLSVFTITYVSTSYRAKQKLREIMMRF